MNTRETSSFDVPARTARRSTGRSRAAAASLAAIAALALEAHAQVTLEYLAPQAGQFSSAAYGCNATGSTVAVISFGQTVRALRWTPSVGSMTVAALIPSHSASAFGMSGNGGTMVGTSENSGSGPSVRRPVIWRGGLPPIDLGNLPGTLAGLALASNYEGSVIVGMSEPYAYSNLFKGFRWTEVGGMVAIPGPNGLPSMIPSDVSDDGEIIVGEAASVACRVVGPPGEFIPQSLGVLPGTSSSRATAISGDGTVIVGYSSSPWDEVPFRWSVNGGMVALPVPTGFARPFDVSNNGRTIVGQGTSSSGTAAIAWSEGLGFVNLNAYLDSQGVSRGGDTLSTATGVSRNGDVIVGYTDGGKAFRITGFNVPASIPGDLDGDGVVDSTDLAILLGNWGGRGAADINGDGVVNSTDLGILLSNWT